MSINEKVSITMPAKNEAKSLLVLLSKLKALYSQADSAFVIDGLSEYHVDLRLNAHLLSQPKVRYNKNVSYTYWN